MNVLTRLLLVAVLCCLSRAPVTAADDVWQVVPAAAHGVFTDGQPVRVEVRLAAPAAETLPISVRVFDLDGCSVEDSIVEIVAGTSAVDVELTRRRHYLRVVAGPAADTTTVRATCSLAIVPEFPHADRRFGLNARPEEAVLVRALGAYWVRSHLPWQQEAGQPLRWDGADSLLAQVTAAGCGLFAISSYGLPWATVVSDDDDRPMKGYFSVPRAAPWDAYVRGVAEHFGSRCEYFEVWNEPNFDHFWRSLPDTPAQRLDDYADLLKRTYAAMKDEAPGLQVTTGSIVTLSSRNAEAYLRGLVERGAADSFDVLNLHYYRARLGPEPECTAAAPATASVSLVDYLTAMRACLAERRPECPVWITEMGWPTRRPAWGWGEVEVSEPCQAAFLVRSHVLAFAAGVEGVIWFQLAGEDFGIVDAHGPKPACAAYARLVQALHGRRFRDRLEAPAGVHAYRFAGPLGSVTIAWSIPASEWRPPVGAVRAADLLGEAVPIVGETLALGPAPVYLYAAP